MANRKKDKNLFHKAIIVSPPSGAESKSIDQMKEIGLSFARNVSCTKPHHQTKEHVVDIACLRKLSTLSIAFATKFPDRFGVGHKFSDTFYWWPHVDNNLIKKQPLDMAQETEFPVPTMIGVNRDEVGFFTSLEDYPLIGHLFGRGRMFNQKAMADKMKAFFKDKAEELNKLYTYSNDAAKNSREFVRLATEFFFTCPTVHTATALSKRTNVYLYELTQVQPALPTGRCQIDYVCHGFELPLIWRTSAFLLSSACKKTSDAWHDYMVGFMNGDIDQRAKDVKWPAYQSGKYLDMGDKFQVKSGLRTEACRVWNQLGFTW
jgi:carboxylesterase type B